MIHLLTFDPSPRRLRTSWRWQWRRHSRRFWAAGIATTHVSESYLSPWLCCLILRCYESTRRHVDGRQCTSQVRCRWWRHRTPAVGRNSTWSRGRGVTVEAVAACTCVSWLEGCRLMWRVGYYAVRPTIILGSSQDLSLRPKTFSSESLSPSVKSKFWSSLVLTLNKEVFNPSLPRMQSTMSDGDTTVVLIYEWSLTTTVINQLFLISLHDESADRPCIPFHVTRRR